MRPVLHGDLVAAARVLLGLPAKARQGCLARILDEAHWADRYRKRTGRAHPLWGDGSVMAAALRRPALPEPALGERDYAECMILVLEGVLARRAAQPAAQETHTGTAGSISSRPRGIGSPHSVQ